MSQGIATVEITGDKELDLKLSKLVQKAQKKIFRKGARAAAKIVKEAIKVEGMSISKNGRLAKVVKNLRIKSMKPKRGSIGVSVLLPERSKIGLSSDEKTYYPIHIELGTRNTPPQPFMRRGLEKSRERAENELRNVIRNELALEAAK